MLELVLGTSVLLWDCMCESVRESEWKGLLDDTSDHTQSLKTKLMCLKPKTKAVPSSCVPEEPWAVGFRNMSLVLSH